MKTTLYFSLQFQRYINRKWSGREIGRWKGRLTFDCGITPTLKKAANWSYNSRHDENCAKYFLIEKKLHTFHCAESSRCKFYRDSSEKGIHKLMVHLQVHLQANCWKIRKEKGWGSRFLQADPDPTHKRIFTKRRLKGHSNLLLRMDTPMYGPIVST